ncbi:MAG TPA: FKBP-type peptidyl-prolyl cis-trans isomerase [Acidimicrobiales bacterium]|nr:FKBP-type peptidyl-prolyl cis-trans isomerase [Acidimicrobiales bacterium]
MRIPSAVRHFSPPRRVPFSGRRARLAAAVVGSALALAGCSSSPSNPPPPTSAPTSTGVPISAATMTWSPAGTWGVEPTVIVPSGTPPTQLLSKDLIVGTGTAAQDGDSLTMQYVGYSWTKKAEFDASWSRGQPLSFTIGIGQVIPGWDQGIVGMKVGGRRELVIPPNLAYGAQSPTPAIAANDTLIFIVDLLNVSPPSSGSTTSTAP